MGYLNVDDQLAFHRKTVAAGNAAMGLWVRAGSWASGQKYPPGEERDGHIPTAIAQSMGKRTEITALINVGLWERVADGYQMHDYGDHNMLAAEQRAISEKRAAAGRKGGAHRPGLRAIKNEANREAKA